VNVHRLTASLVAALVLAATACGSDKPDQPNQPGQQPAGAGGGPTGQTADPPAANIEACSLLKTEEITPIIGPNDGGQPSGDGDLSVCTWENPDTSAIVKLHIGNARTAADGTLPSADPMFGPYEEGPGGIRFAPMDTAEFVLHDRACHVQVILGPTKKTDRETLVTLVGLAKDRA
jgi:hypothetical protein